jgi:2-C-methyl-D-erythritol 4-phosphate cytidylyltransferase
MSDIQFSAIIPAAGIGRRTGEPVPKPWLELGPNGEPMVVLTLSRFVGIPGLRRVVLALMPEELEVRKKELARWKLPLELSYCPGGLRRQDTVAAALQMLETPEDEMILIHDAARPFVTAELIRKVVEKAHEGQAAIAAIPAEDTIKEVDRVGFVRATPPRRYLWRAQTPQAIRAGILRRGLAIAAQREIELSDDATAAELMGFRVAIVHGSADNFKITTARDLTYARWLMKEGELQ